MTTIRRFRFLTAVLFLCGAFLPVAAFAQSGGFTLLPACARQTYEVGSANIPPPPSINCVILTLLNTTQIILGLSGSIALAWFVWAGFLLLKSQGSAGDRDAAKKIIKNVVYGIILIFAGGIAVNYGIKQLGIQNNVNIVGQACGQGGINVLLSKGITCETGCNKDGLACKAVSDANAQSLTCLGPILGCEKTNTVCCITGQ